MREQEVLAALRQDDQWIGRSELARRLGKKRLYESDVVALAVLTTKGLVEAQKIEDSRPIGFAVKYRAKQGV